MKILRWFAAIVAALAGAFGGFLTFWAWGLVRIDVPLALAIGVTAFLATTLAALGAAAAAPTQKLLTTLATVAALVAYGVWSFATDSYLGRNELDLLVAGVLGCVAAGIVCVLVVRTWSAAHA